MVRHVKCCTNINYYSQLSLKLAFIPSALQIKKQKWDHEVDFFFQAVNKSQAAIRTQQPAVLTLKSSYSPVTKKKTPQTACPSIATWDYMDKKKKSKIKERSGKIVEKKEKENGSQR